MRGRALRAGGLLWGLVLALALTACAGGEPPEESALPTAPPTAPPEPLVFALGYDPEDDLHPLRGSSQLNQDWVPLVYECLYELDNTFTPQPRLARSAAVSEDGRVWTLTLAGKTFSDGTPVTGEQVAASLLAAKGSEVYGQRLASVSGVTVDGESGDVVITLSRPNGSLPALLDVPIVLEGEEGAPPLGSGPYILEGGGDSRLLTANPRWWGTDQPPYGEIPLRPITTADRHIAAFSSGEITAVTTDFTGTNALGYSGTYETHDYPTSHMLYVGFNTDRRRPCANAGLRLALSRAMDRSSIVSAMLSGHALSAALPLSPLHGAYDEGTAAELDYQVAAAEEGLAELGYAPGDDGVLKKGRQRLSLTMVVNNDSAAKVAIAEYLARSFQSLGMEIVLQPLSWDDYIAALSAGEFDLYLGEVKLTGDFDLTALLTGELNYGGYENWAVFGALQRFRLAVDGEERAAAASALFEAMAADLPFATLCFKHNSLLLQWGVVSGVTPARGDPLHGIEGWTVLQ